MDFSSLKSASSKDFTSLVNAAQDAGGAPTQKKSYVDERQWKPTVDKSGNGYAVIRFLPQPAGEKLPWARYWDHGFQGPGGQWYIEKSLTSLGQQDPLGEFNSKLWNSGNEEDREQVRKQKRRLHYVVNILVVSDPSAPDNEGKVFMYQFGKKIYDKIIDAMQPEFADEKPVDPFNFWEGADFKLKIRQVEGYRNYDKSEFASASVLYEDEAKLETIYNMMHPIGEWADPANYKSYDELKRKMNMILAITDSPTIAQQSQLGEETVAAPIKEMQAPVTAAEMPAEEDDTLSYFAKIANG